MFTGRAVFSSFALGFGLMATLAILKPAWVPYLALPVAALALAVNIDDN
jgi:hypothetical protein